jgi:uncharacterized SAM-binding protein YcdF (DUF218 family)
MSAKRDAGSRKCWKWIVRICAVLAAILLWAGYFFAVPLLHLRSGSVQAQVVVVLGGDPNARPFRALELFKARAGRQILVSGDGDNDFIRDRLVLAGVPPGAIVQEPNSRNTKENAEFSVHWLKEHGVTSVVVVTSWYHSRRAVACFRHYAKSDVQISSSPAYPGMKLGPRPSPHELVILYVEYLKIAWYGVRYGIWPWDAGEGGVTNSAA